ncbi:multicopper oxidase family protein [Actinopolymorpha singaporensis]
MRPVDRRTLLRAALATAGAGLLASCGEDNTPAGSMDHQSTGHGSMGHDSMGHDTAATPTPHPTGRLPKGFVGPDGPQVRAAEAARKPGRIRDFRLTATTGQIDLGGKTVSTWTYGGRLPGKPIRVTAGEVVRARLSNQLPADTTVHWHGLSLRNDADGVPGVTQKNVPTGKEFTYEFTAANPGTYWFHPHTGPQLDRGLYAPLIVDDPNEPLDYDDEWIVVLDDWLDGVTGTPERVLAELRRGMGGGMSGDSGYMTMGATSPVLGGDAGDVRYPHFLVNGRLPSAPASYRGKPGVRLRIRFVNASGDTAFRVALGGHRMTVTHTDGYAVNPVQTDALLLGMGERYDVLVTLGSGVFPLAGVAEGKKASALAVVRTGAGSAPTTRTRPRELDGHLVSYRELKPADDVRLANRAPDRTETLKLTGSMMKYDWAFDGKPYDLSHVTPVRAGERVRLNFVNTTTMWHPIHLHGHTFALGNGLRKDTAIVLPRKTLTVDFDADNPGIWMVHCHNVYHAEAGMMTLLGYRT